MATISTELKETVAKMPHIKQVHFTAKGDHYLVVHETKGKKYGRHNIDQVKAGTQGDRTLYKNKSVPVAETMIVETLTREQILKAKIEEPAAKN